MTRTIRTLTLPEIETLIDWAAGEGWNPGLHDARAFQAADPSGFFGAFIGDTLVAGISAVAYNDRFGFIGLYICHPGWRGQGHGKAVWDAGMTYLGNRTIGLDGVPEQQANYARMGFVVAYDTMRWSGTLPAPEPYPSVRAVTDPAEIMALDRRCFPAPRSEFVRHWIAPPHRSLVLQRDGHVVGWAVSRPCRSGSKIGPLFAADLEAAMALLRSFSGDVHIDVPVAQREFAATLSGFGFAASFRTSRMYRGEPPSLELPLIYGVTSLELG
ncbi:GNAT family N-acetyltransferase [Devosia nitrariae]|uniref:Acetyltransferase n=1 Tax=Devosia nitrariae TaxID=2071872 RepID=A0ABQ5WAY1_9HYPH|nr:GNAT family N-acetyltransferase [Devosia nitrariae]GLQ56974.1 acetyltransferase [Devosia nitrariae]